MEHPHGREMGHLGRPDMEPFSIRKLDSSCQGMVFPATICSVVNCFVFVTQGEILVGSNNSSLLVGVGELLLVPQGVPFTIKHYKECVGYMGGFHSSFIERSCNTFTCLSSAWVKTPLPMKLLWNPPM